MTKLSKETADLCTHIYIYVLININDLIIKNIFVASMMEFQCYKHDYHDYGNILYPSNSIGCYKLGRQTNDIVDFKLIEVH